jgi:putative heme-binding domain-containing protein
MLRSLERWPRWSAAVRETVLAQFIPDANFASGLLDALEEGSIAAASLSIDARKRLLEHRDISVRGRAKALFAAAERDRMKVFETYRPALELRGSPESGRAVFRELCAPCHRLEREGIDVGPDLFGVRNQEKETLLLHIIVPNREIPSGFEATVVVTKDGETLVGWITSETPGSITVRQKGGLEQTLLRDDVVSTTVSPVSLMPEGLEATLSLQGMADLLAYLRGEG